MGSRRAIPPERQSVLARVRAFVGRYSDAIQEGFVLAGAAFVATCIAVLAVVPLMPVRVVRVMDPRPAVTVTVTVTATPSPTASAEPSPKPSGSPRRT